MNLLRWQDGELPLIISVIAQPQSQSLIYFIHKYESHFKPSFSPRINATEMGGLILHYILSVSQLL